MSEVICSICGSKLVLDKTLHYISRDYEVKRTGLTAFVGGTDNEPQLYDTFDCQYCGCQNTVQVRKYLFVQENQQYEDEDAGNGEEDQNEDIFLVCAENCSGCEIGAFDGFECNLPIDQICPRLWKDGKNE